MRDDLELLKKDRCLLLLVDLQKSMLDSCLEADQVRKRSAVLLDMAQLFEIPVIFTEQNPDRLGSFLPELLERIQQPRVFQKIEFGCFENPEIRQAVEETGRNILILAGIETHVCIFQTGIQALRLGYRVHVVSDAVSSPNRLDQETGLRRLELAGAIITSAEMAIFELLNRAGTPAFRQALPLIKTL